MKLIELIEARARAVAAMRTYNEAGDEAKFNEINTEVEALDTKIANLQKIEKAESVQAAFNATRQPEMENIGTGVMTTEDEFKAKHNKAFSSFLRNGIGGLSAEDQNVMRGMFVAEGGKNIRNAQTVTTTGGGYIVAPAWSAMLEEALLAFGGILANCDTFSTDTGVSFPWPTINDTTNEGEILGINTQLNEQDMVFSQTVFSSYTHNSKSILIPIQLMQDSFFNLDAMVARIAGTRLGRGMNHKLTTGTGSSEPSGIVTEVVASGNTYTTAGAQTSTIIGDDLINLEHTVDPAYRQGAKYMFNDATLKAIKKLKDSYGRYLWLPGLAANDPNTINGYEYVINQHMPSLGRNGSPLVGNNFMLFGALKNYKVRRVAGETTMMRLVERYADYLQVGFQAFVRYDAKLIDAGTHPIAVAVQAAS